MQAPYEAIMVRTENDIVTRCQQGDLNAFRELYLLHEQQVYRYAYHILGRREDADDIKQETFLRAWQGIGRFRSDASVQTWLLKICANLCRDRLRSWDHRKVQYDSTLASTHSQQTCSEDDPAQQVERAETTALILQTLKGLPPNLREAFLLHEIEGHDYDTMASILGCSRASAKLRVFRARQMMRERVQAQLKER